MKELKRIIFFLILIIAAPLCVNASELSDAKITSVWTDTGSNTAADETESPSEHPDGVRNVRIKVSYDKTALGGNAYIAYYGSDNELLKVMSSELREEDNGYAAEYDFAFSPNAAGSIKTFLWDNNMRPVAVSKAMSCDELKNSTMYNVPKYPHNGKYFLRAGFETESYAIFPPPRNGTKMQRTNEVTANSGEYCAKITGTAAEAVQAEAANVNANAALEASCAVRPASGTRYLTYTIKCILPTAAGLITVKSADVTADEDSWTKLKLSVDLSQYSLTGDPIFTVENKRQPNSAFYIDDFIISSDAEGERIDDSGTEYSAPVANSEKNGNYFVRCAFESGTLERIIRDDDAEYFITDEVPAASGNHCLKIADRLTSGGTLKINLNGIDKASRVNISCKVRITSPYIWRETMTFQAKLPTASGDKWPVISPNEYPVNCGWRELKGTVNLSDYALTGTPMIQIVANSGTSLNPNMGKYYDYYVDDLVITADTSGSFYDDEDYTAPIKPDGISDTASEISAYYSDIQNDIPILKDVYKDYFKVGAAVADYRENDINRYGRLIKKHFNSIVSNGMFQQGQILPGGVGSKYKFNRVDSIMDFASRNGLEVVGHALIWDYYTTTTAKMYPNGGCTRDGLISFMQEYITKVMRHCEGDGKADEYTGGYDYSKWHVDTWDVVNEAVQALWDIEAGLKYSDNKSYYSVIGKDYVDYAFKFAAEAGYDDIKLRYNDYGVPNELQTDGVVKLVKELKANGRRVDIIGMQCHNRADFSSFDGLRDMFDKYISAADELNITELDVQAYTGDEHKAKSKIFENGITKEREYKQAAVYERLFDIYKEYKGVITRVNLWSFDDSHSCWNNADYAHKEYAGIFDRNYQAKPQYWAIANPDMLFEKYPDYEAYAPVYSWRFETNHDLSETGETEKWTAAVQYSPAGQDNTIIVQQPEQIKITQADKTYPDTKSWWAKDYDEQYNGSDIISPGSSGCVRLDFDTNECYPYFAGMKTKLSKARIKPGNTYVLTMYALTNAGSRRLYTNLSPHSDTLIHYRSTDTPWLNLGENAAYNAVIKNHWEKYSVEFTPEDKNFDEEGYADLTVIFGRNRGGWNDYVAEDKFYIDDIEITLKNQ